jgi:SAM-dependent methyltransferase
MTGPVQIEMPDCALCGGDRFETVYARVQDPSGRKQGTFAVERCVACELVMTRPRPTKQGLGYYYENEMTEHATRAVAEYERGNWTSRQVSRYRLRVISRVRELGPADRLLDIGCSYGGFLQEARRQSGCEASGIDISAEAIAGAVEPDAIEYRTGYFDDEDFDDGRFTVVTAFQCLEHTPDPVATLRKIHRVLAPGGLCVLEVPNFAGFWRQLFGASWLGLVIPQHLVHFTPTTLRAAVEAAHVGEIAHQQTMFYPVEGMGSAWLELCRRRSWDPLAIAKRPTRLRDWLIGTPLAALAAATYLFAEVPSQALLQLLGKTGNQLIIARKPS